MSIQSIFALLRAQVPWKLEMLVAVRVRSVPHSSERRLTTSRVALSNQLLEGLASVTATKPVPCTKNELSEAMIGQTEPSCC